MQWQKADVSVKIAIFLIYGRFFITAAIFRIRSSRLYDACLSL
jgi:hypothetical protein